jgi:hypothetical protein
LIVERASGDEDSPPEHPMGFNPQETFTQHDEACYVQDSVGIQIMEMNPISKEEPAEEWMWGKRKHSEKKSKEDYPESSGRPRDDFCPAM